MSTTIGKLSSKVALVTGGSRGLGFAIAHALEDVTGTVLNAEGGYGA